MPTRINSFLFLFFFYYFEGDRQKKGLTVGGVRSLAVDLIYKGFNKKWGLQGRGIYALAVNLIFMW